jgi:hypothetical protein
MDWLLWKCHGADDQFVIALRQFGEDRIEVLGHELRREALRFANGIHQIYVEADHLVRGGVDAFKRRVSRIAGDQRYAIGYTCPRHCLCRCSGCGSGGGFGRWHD